MRLGYWMLTWMGMVRLRVPLVALTMTILVPVSWKEILEEELPPLHPASPAMPARERMRRQRIPVMWCAPLRMRTRVRRERGRRMSPAPGTQKEEEVVAEPPLMVMEAVA